MRCETMFSLEMDVLLKRTQRNMNKSIQVLASQKHYAQFCLYEENISKIDIIEDDIYELKGGCSDSRLIQYQIQSFFKNHFYK